MPEELIGVVKFPATRISSQQVVQYILDLYKNEDLRSIGYIIDGNQCTLVTFSYDTDVMRYFKNKTPEMVEAEVMNTVVHKLAYMTDNVGLIKPK